MNTGGKKIPSQKKQQYPSFYLLHKLFQERIKMLSEENKCFTCGNSHPEPGNCRPILESGYLMIKDNEGAKNMLAIIESGRKKTTPVSD